MMEYAHDTEHPIVIDCGDVKLESLLFLPKEPTGMVLFAHGSGSSRLSPRNQFIARDLQKINKVTLLFDLLTPEEEALDVQTSQYRFDIGFLADRLSGATEWLMKNPVLKKLPMGYFGASTGGGAALVAAARQAMLIKAVVSRGGRPDLAGESLPYVKAPTLLIVGSLDDQVIELNEKAYQALTCEKKMEIVPGATHLFEEPGKLEEVSHLTAAWFKQYLR